MAFTGLVLQDFLIMRGWTRGYDHVNGVTMWKHPRHAVVVIGDQAAYGVQRAMEAAEWRAQFPSPFMWGIEVAERLGFV